jgi:hypothetical protein
MQRAVDLVATHGSVAAAARATGLPYTTLQSQYYRARNMGIARPTCVVPDRRDAKDDIIDNLRGEIDRLKSDIVNASKPHFTVRQDYASRSSKIRVVCIGDAHDSPNIPDKSRFEWMGKYIREQKPDVVVQIGDFATLDSLNGHIPNETLDGRLKPSFENDMGSLNLALQAMQLDGVETHCTLGNHERRLYLYEQNHPEMDQKLASSLDDIFKNNGWTYSPYGQITYYGGVGFVHAAINRMGKTYGGKTSENTIANDSIHDLVIGHSHVERMQRAAKIGGNNYVQILNVGCALPDQHIEEYAKHCLNGWSWGIYDLTIQHGHIQDRTWVSMRQLGERYGNV